ncbi:SDR family NAD(P)-dependent oxidoreductase [Desulfobacula sp.]
MNGKLAVITGGSSGIGYAIAKKIALNQGRLLLVARNQDKLNDAAAQLNKISRYSVSTISADVSKLEDVDKIRQTIKSLTPAADIIINSAGIVSAGKLDEVPPTEWDRLFNLNVGGLVKVLQALVPDMRRQSRLDRQERHIVNVGSAAGLLPFPGMSAYSATKAAVIALTESLRAELAPFKIGVTVLCPDYVKTPLADTVKLFGSIDNLRMKKKIKKRFESGNLSPETVAEVTLKAIKKNKGVVIVGRQARMGYMLKRLSPALLDRVIKNFTP